MLYLDIAIIIFVIMESANVIILYFAPDSRLGNGVAVFNSWFALKKDVPSMLYSKYMVNWVANSKLIFIGLLLTIFFTADEYTKLISVIFLIFSIAVYYWRLNPIITELDKMDAISPKGYSKVLPFMIAGFIAIFSLAVMLYFIN